MWQDALRVCKEYIPHQLCLTINTKLCFIFLQDAVMWQDALREYKEYIPHKLCLTFNTKLCFSSLRMP